MSIRIALGCVLAVVAACNPGPSSSLQTTSLMGVGGVGMRPATMRYRLKLGASPGAFRCFSACQVTPTQEAYVECLRRCPGFEATAGSTCTRADVIPRAACITVRTPARRGTDELESVVVAIVGDIVLTTAILSLCKAPSCDVTPY